MGIILNRRRVYGGGKSLPYDAEIEYLESSGTQYIDTLIPFSTSSVITCKMDGKFTKTPKNGSTYQNKYMCAVGGNPKVIWMGYLLSEKYTYGVIDSVVDSNIPLTVTNVTATVNFNTQIEIINGSVYNISGPTNYTVLNGTTLLLFARHFQDGGGAAGFCYIRLQSFKIMVDNVLVRDFIPVRVGQVGYMYDKVSGQLFGNAGTGAFVLGPDKEVPPSRYTQLEYIESNSTQYIDTQIIARNVEYIKAKVMATSIISTSSWQTFIGAVATNNDQRCIFAWASDMNVLGYRWHMTGSPIQSNINFNENTEYVLEVTGNRIRFNNNTINIPDSYENSDRYLHLFCQGAENSNPFRGRIYYTQLGTDENTLVRNLIPCRRNSDNTVGMYDTVESKFYSSPNGVPFIAGPEVQQLNQ